MRSRVRDRQNLEWNERMVCELAGQPFAVSRHPQLSSLEGLLQDSEGKLGVRHRRGVKARRVPQQQYYTGKSCARKTRHAQAPFQQGPVSRQVAKDQVLAVEGDFAESPSSIDIAVWIW